MVTHAVLERIATAQLKTEHPELDALALWEDTTELHRAQLLGDALNAHTKLARALLDPWESACAGHQTIASNTAAEILCKETARDDAELVRCECA